MRLPNLHYENLNWNCSPVSIKINRQKKEKIRKLTSCNIFHCFLAHIWRIPSFIVSYNKIQFCFSFIFLVEIILVFGVHLMFWLVQILRDLHWKYSLYDLEMPQFCYCWSIISYCFLSFSWDYVVLNRMDNIC